jgi:hypothetical protein
MKQSPRWSWLPALALPALVAWLIALPQPAPEPVAAAPQHNHPPTPPYPAPQVNDALPPEDPPPTF